MRFVFAGMNTLADPASIDCFNGKSKQYGQCVDILNCDIDDENNAISRDGFTRVVAGAVTSAWTDKNGVTYCIHNGRICTFDGASVSVLDADTAMQPACEFVQVNDVVVFSDNVKIGIIEDGFVTLISHPSDWVDATELEAWIAAHYPADFQAEESNFEVDAFKLATMAGKCLDFFNGVLYLAVDNFIYATKAHNVEHMDIRYNVVAGFSDPVSMIRHVADGLYVGTSKGCWFLEGGGLVVDENFKVLAGFSQRRISQYGAIYGTGLHAEGRLLPKLQFDGMVAMWASPLGVFAGVAGGIAVNLSSDKIELPDVAAGCAMFRELNGIAQYLVCLDISAALFIDNDTKLDSSALKDTWLLNSRTLAHSRYSRYPFNSLFLRGSTCYGANKLGIFRIGGDTDFAGVSDLSVKVSAHVLTPSSDLKKKEAKRLPGLYLQARCGGELAVDLYVNEQLEYEDDLILFDDNEHAHTRRASPPKGLRGTFWQFKVKNVNGSRFTLFNLEPVLTASGRTS